MVDWDARAIAERNWPYVLLGIIVAFMFWVRMRPVERVITGSAVFFSGNDPWYHKRMVELAVRHFPDTTPFDPWTRFPFGTGYHSGFGGLFDQLIAGAALIVGLGSPSEHTTDIVLAIAPPVFGALTALPTYVIARRVTDRIWGLVAAVILALLGGGILARTVVGTADHQAAEALFGAVAVAGFIYAIVTAYRESPMVEDVKDRNWSVLYEPTLAGLAGGVGVASYLALWAPGVMLLFTFGIFVVVQVSREHVAGRVTDHVGFATVLTMLTAGVLSLLYARSYTIESNEFSLLQPLVAFGLAAGTVVLLGISRYFEQERIQRRYFPITVVGLLTATLVLGWLVYPRSIDLLRQLIVRIYSFGLLTSPSALTVAEIQPPSLGDAFRSFGTVFPLAILGLLLMAYHVFRENRPVELLVVFWSLTMLSAYFTMARFGYYLAVNVAILAGFAIWWVVTRWLALDTIDVDDLRSVETYQVIGVLVILLLVAPGNVVAISGQQPVWNSVENPALSGTDQAWYEGMGWMEENTPEVPMDYYRQYDRPQDLDYEYPEEAYGVMSWWDYGHWITVMGHRIPYANPFQEGPRPASAYFQATNETRANLILDALPSMRENPSRAATMSATELRDVVADQSPQHASEDGKYVVIDDQMAGGKFPAITQWAGPSTEDYFQQSQYRIQGQDVTLPETTDRYDQTMLSRLYYGDASGLSHYRLVHEVDQYALVGGYIRGQQIRTLTSLAPPGWDWQTVEPIAAQVQQSNRAGQVVSLGEGSGQYVYNAHVESRVKIYERVEGATITGTVPDVQNETSVVAYVRLQTDTGRNFTYIQQTTTDQDGSFAMTVPYATDDTVGPEAAGTNSSVRALGEYTVQAGTALSASARGTTAVSEDAIYEGREIQVELETVEQGNESAPPGNETAGTENGTTGSGSESTDVGNQSSGSDDGSSESGNETAGSLAAERHLAPAEP